MKTMDEAIGLFHACNPSDARKVMDNLGRYHSVAEEVLRNQAAQQVASVYRAMLEEQMEEHRAKQHSEDDSCDGKCETILLVTLLSIFAQGIIVGIVMAGDEAALSRLEGL